MSLSWSAALSWRMRRQLLDPIGTAPVADVVRRLGAVPASAAELTIRVRRVRSRPGEVARALAEGRIIKTYAFRGATHLLTPEDGGAYLALRAASRMWELSSWQSFYGLAPEDWPSLPESGSGGAGRRAADPGGARNRSHRPAHVPPLGVRLRRVRHIAQTARLAR